MTDVKRGPAGRGPASPKQADFKTLEKGVLDAKTRVRESKRPQPKKKFSRNKETIDTLKNSLDTNPKFGKMVEYSVTCLKGLAVDENSIEEMIEEGVLDSLLRVLKLNPYNEKIQRMINDALAAFCINDRMAALVAEKLGAAPLVHSMKKHVEPETLLSTTSTLATLLKSKDKMVTDSFIKGGVLGGIQHVIQNVKKVPIVEEAVDSLDKIAGTDPRFAKAVFESGNVEPTLKFWQEHLDEPKLTESCISLLANLAKASPQQLEALKKMGAVDLLLAALDAHPDNERIAQVGVEALKQFTNQSDVGAALVVQAGNNKATAQAAGKLSSLLLVPENVDYMAKHEGIPWLIAALKAATGQEGEVAQAILRAGTRALGRMATGEDKIYTIMKEGGVKTLVAILNAHKDDEDVACPALHALDRMLTRKPNADFLLKSGALDAALSFLAQNPDSEQAAIEFLKFVEDLAKYPEHVGSLIPLANIIVETINKHGTNPQVAQSGMVALGRMATSADNMDKLVAAGALGAGVAVLSKHGENPKVAKTATMLLETATMLPTTIEPLRKLGAVNALADTLGANPDDAELQEIGDRTLAAVAAKPDLLAALQELKKLPRDPTKAEGAYPHNLLAPSVVVDSLVGDPKKGAEYRDYAIKNGAVPICMGAFEAVSKLPVKSKDREPILRNLADALAELASNPAALDELKKKQFGRTLNDVAEKSGDPELQKIADRFQDVTGGAAGGGDPDAERERQLQEALDDVRANVPKNLLKPGGYEGSYSQTGKPGQFSTSGSPGKFGGESVPGRKNNNQEAGMADPYPDDVNQIFGKLPASNVDPYGTDKRWADKVFAPVDWLKDQLGDDENAKKNAGFLNDKGAVKDLIDAFQAAQKLPDTDKKKLPLEKAAAEALLALAPEPGAVDKMNDRRIGKDIRDEATRTGDPDLRRVADALAKLPGGAGGADEPSYGDPNDRKEVARALRDLEKATQDAKAGKPNGKQLAIPAAFLDRAADNPSNAEDLDNAGAVRKLIDAWEALAKLPPGDPIKKKGLKWVAEALKKLPDKGNEKEKRKWAKIIDDEAKATGDPELQKLAEDFRKLGYGGGDDNPYGNPNDEKAIGRALRDLDDALKDVKAGRNPGKVNIPACFLGQAADDPKAREYMGNNGAVKKLIDLFENLGKMPPGDPNRRKAMKNIAELLRKLAQEPGPAKEIARSRFLPMLKEEAARSKDPELQSLAEEFQSLPAFGDSGPMKMDSGPKSMQSVSPSKSGQGLGSGASPPVSGPKMKSEVDPKQFYDLAKKGGLRALADLLNKNKDNDDIFPTAAGVFADLLDKLPEEELKKVLDDPACVEALCNIMKANERLATPLALGDLAKAIGGAAKHKLKPATVKQILKNNPLSALNRIVSQTDDPLLLANAGKLLGRLANNDEALAMLAGIASIRELIDAMRRNIKNEEFLRYGCYLLGEFAMHENLKSEIGIEGGIGLVLQICGMYPRNKDLMENACYMLAKVSYNHPVNSTFVVASKGPDILIGLIAQYPKAEDLLESDICTLCNICYQNDRNKDLIIKAGGAQAIVDCVLNNFDAVDLVVTALRTLGQLAYNTQCSEAIIKAGGVQAIVAGMTVHADKEEVILMAIRVLTNLAADASDENMQIMASEGAVQAVVEASINYVKYAELELACLGCLCNLGLAKYNASMIVKQGGAEAVVDAFQTHSYEAKMAEKGARLLHILTHSTADLDRMLDGKVTDALCQCIKSHGKSRPILGPSLNAVAALSYGEKSAKRMNNESKTLIPSVMVCHKSNMNDPLLVIDSFKALGALARDEGNASGMADMTFKNTITAFQQHSSNTKVLDAGFKFLANLCFHKTVTETVPTVNIVPAVLTSLGIHKTEPATLIFGCKALENMAYGSVTVRDYMKKEGTIQAMKDIQTNNPTRDDVRRAAQAVIDALLRVDADIDFKPYSLMPMMEKRKLKDIFGKEDKGPVVELPKDIRNLLNAGALMMKHSKTAPPRKKHVYCDIDFKKIIWKDPKEKGLNPKNTMKIGLIKQVEKGHCTPPLQRVTLIGKKPLAKEDCSFACIGRERSVDLECASHEEREKWVHAIEVLLEWKKGLKMQASVFGNNRG